MSKPRATGIYVPKFEWCIGELMADVPVKTWQVSPTRSTARVEEETGKIRWFLNVNGTAVEIRCA